MCQRMLGLLAVAAFFASLGTASAQTLETPPVASTRPAVEVGVGFSGAFPATVEDWRTTNGYFDMHENGVNLRLTVPLTDRFAVEGLAIAGRRNTWNGNQVGGLYGAQIKQRIVSGNRRSFDPFVTYGMVGRWWNDDRFGSTVYWPIFVQVGGGVQQSIGHRIALRAELQEVFIVVPGYAGPTHLALRPSVGVSIPIGRGRTVGR
jgi:hypothetical protein